MVMGLHSELYFVLITYMIFQYNTTATCIRGKLINIKNRFKRKKYIVYTMYVVLFITVIELQLHYKQIKNFICNLPKLLAIAF